jgi:NAD-dependent dihydropyrimidine dehydrogenase PreA subunit
LPKITVDLEKCEGAGVCVEVCPVNVYDIEKMPEHNNQEKALPNRMDDCIMCLACVSACPTQAITIED